MMHHISEIVKIQTTLLLITNTNSYMMIRLEQKSTALVDPEGRIKVSGVK